jgi:hypothetical protein
MQFKRKTSKTLDQISFTESDLQDLLTSFDLIVSSFPTLYNFKGLTRLNECIKSLNHPEG